jgi:purine-binding chemotaxis protein CheW
MNCKACKAGGMNMSEEISTEKTDENSVLDAANTSQFVTFQVGDEIFAVDMLPVQEIIRLPDVVKVPLAPSCLDGLANLRGKVLPIISLRRIFGLSEIDHDDATRAVIINLGQPLGFIVDRVSSVISVEMADIEKVDNIRSTIDSDLLVGVIKNSQNNSMIMVINFSELIGREFVDSIVINNITDTDDAVNADKDDEEDADELQLVSFSVDAEEYGVDINSVQEIVQIPSTIVHVPNSSPHVLGLMTLRERLLPLVSLRHLFNLADKELDDRSRVVVISFDDISVGVVTDSVSEVLRVPTGLIDSLPSLLSKDRRMNDIKEICRLNNGNRLVSIISVQSMFSTDTVKSALNMVTDMNDVSDIDSSDDVDIENDDDEQIVIFKLADNEFGIPIENVQEIVRIPEELTHVPKAPDFVEGVINLRGSVLPVIDQRKRLNYPATERDDHQRIMVFLLKGIRTGFIVDSVTEVLKVPKKHIESSPKLSSEQANLLGRIANLEKEKRIIQLIDPQYLIDDSDKESLSFMS